MVVEDEVGFDYVWDYCDCFGVVQKILWDCFVWCLYDFVEYVYCVLCVYQWWVFGMGGYGWQQEG